MISACLPLRAQTFQPGVALDTVEKEGFHQIAVIGKEYLDVQKLRALYKSRRRETDRVFIIYALANSLDASRMLTGVGATDVEFEGWYNMYRSVPEPNKLQMMQLVAIGRDVVVEAVDGLKVSRFVLSGKDPMLFEFAGRKCQILELHWTRPLIELHKGKGTPLNVSVPLKTDTLRTVAEGEAIAREIQRRLNYLYVFVNIRNDTWFIEDPFYPLWFPFAPGEQPPTNEKEYLLRGSMSCGIAVGESEIGCTRWGQQ